jgi:preprotein translocase subunit SecE
MARVTDGATGPIASKAAQAPSSADRSVTRPGRPVSVRRAPQWIAAIAQFLKDVRAEMNRVAWPDRQTVIASSLVVVFVLVITALYLAGWDLLLAGIFKQILHQ